MEGKTEPLAIAVASADTPPYKSVLVEVILTVPTPLKVWTFPPIKILPDNVGSVIEEKSVPAETFLLESSCTNKNRSFLLTTLADTRSDIFTSAITLPG